MKKLIAILFALCVVLCVNPVFAAEPVTTTEHMLTTETVNGGVNAPSNIKITVVVPDPTPAQTPAPTPAPTPLAIQIVIPTPSATATATPTPATPTPIKVYPSDVTEIRDGGEWQIIKTYELSADEKPEDIPRDSFERQGWQFDIADIIRHETSGTDTRDHAETVTLNTGTKELEKILPLFAPTMEFTADDGYCGMLTLDVSSIKVETSGTKTSSYTMSVTRQYPRLSANDTSLIPKTVEEKGKTYTLAGVSWQAGNTVTEDYNVLPEYYTANATYTATGKSTKVTGYVTTAVYSGTPAKLSQGKTIYTAYFLGSEIRTPLEMMTPAPSTETLSADMSEQENVPISEPDGKPDQTACCNTNSEPYKEEICEADNTLPNRPCCEVDSGASNNLSSAGSKSEDHNVADCVMADNGANESNSESDIVSGSVSGSEPDNVSDIKLDIESDIKPAITSDIKPDIESDIGLVNESEIVSVNTASGESEANPVGELPADSKDSGIDYILFAAVFLSGGVASILLNYFVRRKGKSKNA